MSVSADSLVDRQHHNTPQLAQSPAKGPWSKLNVFAECDSPFNLAVFRIAFFAIVLSNPEVLLGIRFASLPPGLISVPPAMEWFVNYLPINHTAGCVAVALLMFFCVTGFVGLFSRFSAFATALLCTYVFGLRLIYGSFGHGQHCLVWFAFILAFSPCADVLSIDAVRKAWNRRGGTVPPVPNDSPVYGIPLRLIWMLFGVTYFFPGFWKLHAAGLQWGSAENMLLIMRRGAVSADIPFEPFLHIDRYPLILQMGGTGAVFFEISFIVLVFIAAFRPYIALAGIMFHTVIGLLLHIYFTCLAFCYVAFFNWRSIFHTIGKRMFRTELILQYDRDDLVCNRIVSSMQLMDLMGRVEYVASADAGDWAQPHLSCRSANRTVTGVDACLLSMRRIPPMWPLLMVATLVRSLGLLPAVSQPLFSKPRNNAETADSAVSEQENTNESTSPRRWAPVAIVGVAMILINTGLGAMKYQMAWPFACFPLFDRQVRLAKELVVEPLDESGERIRADSLRSTFGKGRFEGLGISPKGRVPYTQNRVRQKEWLEALWRCYVKTNPALARTKSVCFYEESRCVNPSDEDLNKRKLLLDLKL